MPKRRSRRAELDTWLEERRPDTVGYEEWLALRAALAPVSEQYLRKLLRGCGLPLSPAVEGVRQENMESLDRTLAALSAEYEKAAGLSDRDRMRVCRRAVITAKDHARLVLARKPETAGEKREMILRMLTWLENPRLFPAWLRLRAKTNPA